MAALVRVGVKAQHAPVAPVHKGQVTFIDEELSWEPIENHFLHFVPPLVHGVGKAGFGDMQLVKMLVFQETIIIGWKRVADPLLELDYLGM
jgi:hypothetical protein